MVPEQRSRERARAHGTFAPSGTEVPGGDRSIERELRGHHLRVGDRNAAAATLATGGLGRSGTLCSAAGRGGLGRVRVRYR